MLSDALELDALEVHLLPTKMTQYNWNKMFQKMKKYIEHLQENQIATYPEKAEITRRICDGHIHVHIKRCFTTDAILLYSDLRSYVNQTHPLILIGVTNDYGKLSTPLIMDLIVMMQIDMPGKVFIKGYIHPQDWLKSIARLQGRGYL
ncbi:hypothetical protein [Alteribacillus sp. YIM 98480]|uniref:hypothetical protein n=1 Tax=Alteribacillus sp. YIM 98480 TaxID=2606599 RepID=UPI00131CC193|nr:hypothetical protein [Alteribacillus sp. YIM 98480]